MENFRPGTMERWGFSWESLHALNPKLILARTSGFGQKGPYAQRPGFGTVAEAMSGFAHITGFPDGPPTLPPFALADGISALCGTYAVMMALYHRDVHDAPGQEIDIAIYEPITMVLGPQPLEYDQLGYVQMRTGNAIPFAAPRNAYRCKDGRYVVISASAENIFKRVMRAVGREDLADDPRMVTQAGRVEHMAELDDAIQGWIGEHSLEETTAHFEEHECALGPIYDVAQFVADPHVQARETITTVEDDELGPIRMQNVIPRLNGSPGAIRWAGPPMGKHTDEVLEGIGYDAAAIAALERQGRHLAFAMKAPPEHCVFVFHEGYYAYIGQHVLQAEKYRKTHARLREAGLPESVLSCTAYGEGQEELALVHTPEYLVDLRSGVHTARTAPSELPISEEIVNASFLATGGTLLAAREALERGRAVNLTGGFHHAFADQAEGFCYVNDLAVAVRVLMKEGRHQKSSRYRLRPAPGKRHRRHLPARGGGVHLLHPPGEHLSAKEEKQHRRRPLRPRH